MSSRLPRSRPSRRYRPRVGIGVMSREDTRLLIARESAIVRARALAGALTEHGARLDRDPNGYVIAMNGRIVERCLNLDHVEAWLRRHAPALVPLPDPYAPRRRREDGGAA